MKNGIYIGIEFPDYYGNEIEIDDDYSQRNNPCYKIKFEGTNEWIGNMDDSDIQFSEPVDAADLEGEGLDEQMIIDAVNKSIEKNSKEEKPEKKCNASELKQDVKNRQETLSYIRDVMERNNMQHPGELYNYWKNKRDKASETWELLEQSLPVTGLGSEVKGGEMQERFKMPTDDQLIKTAIVFNDGKLEQEKLADMVSMCGFIIQRLYENGDMAIPAKIEENDAAD